jgi:hypothetical protein
LAESTGVGERLTVTLNLSVSWWGISAAIYPSIGVEGASSRMVPLVEVLPSSIGVALGYLADRYVNGLFAIVSTFLIAGLLGYFGTYKAFRSLRSQS